MTNEVENKNLTMDDMKESTDCTDHQTTTTEIKQTGKPQDIRSKKELAIRKQMKLILKKAKERKIGSIIVRHTALCFAITLFVAFYVDFGLDIAAVVEYYNQKDKFGDVYWIGQIVSLVLPPIIMAFYWAWETKRDTKIRSFMAIVPLGIFYEIFFPIAALLHVWPKLRGHEASEPDINRIVRLTTVQIIFENLPQTCLSWTYMMNKNDFSYGVPFFVGISSLVHLTVQFVAMVTSWCNKKTYDDSEENQEMVPSSVNRSP